MTITVPQAGVIAGRAPEDVTVPVPETGSEIAALGSRMVELATQWKQEDRDLQARRTTLDMTRDLAAARREVSQITDPAQLGPTWDQRVAEIRQKYVPEDGSLDPQLAEQLDLNFTELSDRHAAALGNRTIELRQGQQVAAWTEARTDIAAQAIDADPTTFQALVDFGDAAIDQQLANGVLDPEEAAAERAAFHQQVYEGRATAQIDADPQGFLAASAAGDFDALGDRLAGFNAAAQTALDRIEAAAAKDAELAGTQRSEAIDRRLGQMTDLFRAGRVVVDQAFLDDPEVMQSPRWAEAKAAFDLLAETPQIRTMTPAQLDAEIAREKARPVTQPWENRRLEVLTGWRDAASAKWGSDAVSTAQAAGLNVPALPEFDPAQTDSFAEGVTARLALDSALRGNGFTTSQAILSGAERERLKPILDPKADATTKVALAAAVVQGAGQDWPAVAAAMGADLEFVGALRVLAETGDRGLAQSVLRGQQKQASGVTSLPPEKQLQLVFSELTGGVFDNDPATAAELLATARAAYADVARGINPDGSNSTVPFMDDTEAVDLFKTTLMRVMGATPDASGRLTIGGLQEVNGGLVRLPQGMPVNDVTTAWDDVTQQLSGNVRADWAEPEIANTMGAIAGISLDNPSDMFWARPKDGAGPPDPYRALRAASLDGKSTPDLFDDPDGWWSQATLIPDPAGRKGIYALQVVLDDGRPLPIRSKENPGRIWTFRLTDLLREARK